MNNIPDQHEQFAKDSETGCIIIRALRTARVSGDKVFCEITDLIPEDVTLDT